MTRSSLLWLVIRKKDPQVELSLEAAQLAQRNATLGVSDSSPGKFRTEFSNYPVTLGICDVIDMFYLLQQFVCNSLYSLSTNSTQKRVALNSCKKTWLPLRRQRRGHSCRCFIIFMPWFGCCYCRYVPVVPRAWFLFSYTIVTQRVFWFR